MDFSQFLSFEYPSSHIIPHFSPKKIISHEQILQHIEEQITPLMRSISLDEMATRQKRLSDKPLLSYLAMADILRSINRAPVFSWVLLNNIVGKPFEDEDGWAGESPDERGIEAQIAKNFVDHAEDINFLEALFHEKSPDKRIKVVELRGPQGPLYYAADGVKRIAAGIIAGFAEIPCDVAHIEYPLTVPVESVEQYSDWKKKIDLGLIQGEFQSRTVNENQTLQTLTVYSECFQWIRVTSTANLARINRTYEMLYPDGLRDVQLPYEALFDGKALWGYLR